jgi:hypothetical protein
MPSYDELMRDLLRLQENQERSLAEIQAQGEHARDSVHVLFYGSFVVTYFNLLVSPFRIQRQYIEIALSVRPSQKLNIGYNFAISSYFFIKLANYIAYDNTPVMMPKSLGQGHI